MATFLIQIRSISAMGDQIRLASCVLNTQSQKKSLMQIHKWILELCANYKCAPFLMPHFILWQNWKVRSNAHNKHLNDFAENGVTHHV